MSTNAKLGLGVQMKRGDGGGPEIFTALAELVDIGDVGEERKLVDATHHASTIMEYILGMKDGAEFDGTLNFLGPTDATQNAAAGVISDQQNSTRRNYQIVIPTSPTYTASTQLLCRAYKIKPPKDGAMQLICTFKVTGSFVWA